MTATIYWAHDIWQVLDQVLDCSVSFNLPQDPKQEEPGSHLQTEKEVQGRHLQRELPYSSHPLPFPHSFSALSPLPKMTSDPVHYSLSLYKLKYTWHTVKIQLIF